MNRTANTFLYFCIIAGILAIIGISAVFSDVYQNSAKIPPVISPGYQIVEKTTPFEIGNASSYTVIEKTTDEKNHITYPC